MMRYKLTFSGADYSIELFVNSGDSMQYISLYWADFMTKGETLTVERTP